MDMAKNQFALTKREGGRVNDIVQNSVCNNIQQ